MIILKGQDELEIGKAVEYVIRDAEGIPHLAMMMPMRVATKEEWLVQATATVRKLSERDLRDVDDPNTRYYEVSVD